MTGGTEIYFAPYDFAFHYIKNSESFLAVFRWSDIDGVSVDSGTA